MAVTASLVKELRERTGAGMMECKNALVETNGDLEAAVENLRKSGLAKADKKAGRVAAEGKIVIAEDGAAAVLVEVNCETDFVAKDDNFLGFADLVAAEALALGSTDVAALMAREVDGESLESRRQALVSKIGENVQVRRIERLENAGGVGSYVHGGRIGVLVAVDGGDEELAKDIAMHVAALNPQFANVEDVPAEVLAKEKEILVAQAADSGKPADIIEKMVEGRLRKHLAEITLVGQPFVKDGDVTVGKLLEQKGASVKGFTRLAVGEGIEKKEENFAEEVMQQVAGS
ncbi:elongation factor Ts [Marinihelvus fidelis]|uniref:Elongation factor Ts n=1 Tax=Marinihelvus fidelis TaxID=2613842 RepID=A0A5N0T424_9GAMM|nr:translation elongation factor Ts [Marinihelvus fidelis]KAA9129611.1 elongation factor Ts [Marinihelvus fidelis]